MIIQRYIYKELLQKLLWILGLLVLVFASSRFVGFLADAAEGHLPRDLFLLMLGYKILATLPKILPVSIFIATLLAYSRMATERELIILSAAGFSRLFQVFITAKFAIVFCLITAGVTLYVAPWAAQSMEHLKKRARQESDIAGIRAGQFKEFSKGDRVVYVQRSAADNIAMEDVFLQVRQNEKLGLLTAESARFKIEQKSGDKYIVFSDGRRYVSSPNSLDYQITEYEKYTVLTESASVENISTKTSTVATNMLIGSDNKSYQAELQWRLSLVIACLLLSVLAVLLIQFHASERRHQPFIIGIAIYLIYSNLLGIAQTLLKRDIVPAMIGLWWVHLLLMIVLALLYYMPKRQFKHKTHDPYPVIPAK